MASNERTVIVSKEVDYDDEDVSHLHLDHHGQDQNGKNMSSADYQDQYQDDDDNESYHSLPPVKYFHPDLYRLTFVDVQPSSIISATTKRCNENHQQRNNFFPHQYNNYLDKKNYYYYSNPDDEVDDDDDDDDDDDNFDAFRDAFRDRVTKSDMQFCDTNNTKAPATTDTYIIYDPKSVTSIRTSTEENNNNNNNNKNKIFFASQCKKSANPLQSLPIRMFRSDLATTERCCRLM